MIIYLCTPAPLAGVCHYYLIYVSIDCLYMSLITSEEELGTQSLLLLSPGRVLWGFVRDNRVRSSEPTADWRSEVSAKDTLFFPNQGKEEECGACHP